MNSFLSLFGWINCTQLTTIHKSKALTNIDGNEQEDILAKNGTQKKFATKSYEFAHTKPYYLKKDTWPGPRKRHDKNPVICLETYINK